MPIMPAVDQAVGRTTLKLLDVYCPQSHYTGRTIHEKETVQRTDKTVLLRQEHGFKSGKDFKGRFTSRSKKCEALC